MKKKVLSCLKGVITAYALTTAFHAPFFLSQFETVFDYIIASVYELLGEYRLEFVLIWILSSLFYYYTDSKWNIKQGSSKLLAGFFSFCLLFGRSYHELASWDYCLGSPVNFAKFILAFSGYSLFLYTIIGIVFHVLQNTGLAGKGDHFFSRHCFGKSFTILAAVYLIPVLISYPGTLCWDTFGQIEQVTGSAGFSTHHPLAHTLLVGGLVELGHVLFGSYDIGLFLYMLIQVVMLAAALAATIWILAKRNVSFKWLCSLLVLYCISPIYTNIVSVAIKDVPYCAFVIGYGICFFLLMETPSYIHNRKFVISFILMQVGAILMRNNGLVMVLLSGIFALLYLRKKYNFKELLQYCLSAFLVSIVIAKLISLLLVQITGASEGSSAEILSIPFQQTARYLQLYRDQLSAEEKEAIETVLGSVDEIAAKYDPAISDPVKALYNKTATTGELVTYFKAWAMGLFKHPVVYFEAFFAHVYGWFSPNVSNAIRYEAIIENGYISQQGLFPDAQKIMLFFYRFADRISLLSILQNTGAYVWALFFAAYYHIKTKKSGFLTAGLPLWISLLVCMASPCYIYHPRYALPIVFLVPLLYFMTLSSKEAGNTHD